MPTMQERLSNPYTMMGLNILANRGNPIQGAMQGMQQYRGVQQQQQALQRQKQMDALRQMQIQQMMQAQQEKQAQRNAQQQLMSKMSERPVELAGPPQFAPTGGGFPGVRMEEDPAIKQQMQLMATAYPGAMQKQMQKQLFPQAPKLTTVAPGASVYDPSKGKAVFTAPAKPRQSKLYTQDELKQRLQLAGEEARVAAEAKREAQKAGIQPKVERGLKAATAKTEMLKESIQQAKDQSDFWTTGFMGQSLASIGGTKAHDLANTLNTVKANIGFDKLQEMRDASPTGGALGQVSERENILLQSVWGALEQSQTKEQLKTNLDKVEKQVEESWQRIYDAYETDYGSPHPDAQAQKAGGWSIRRK